MSAEACHEVLSIIVNYGIVAFEFVGVIILFLSGIRGTYDYIKRNPMFRLNLANGMAMGLEFKLGSEILRTVIVRELQECMIVGVIILLRASLTFLIHWEIKTEQESADSHPEYMEKNTSLKEAKKIK